MKLDLDRMEDVLMEALYLTAEKTARLYGKAKKLDAKEGGYQGVASANEGNMSLTELDLENQEIILKHLHKHFPWVSVSVEERTSDPTEVQAEFYRNDSDILVQIDPIDGTFCYSEAKNPYYGALASVLQRDEPGKGHFVLSVALYPSICGEFIVANQSGVHKEARGRRSRLERDESRIDKDDFTTVWVYGNERLGIEVGKEDFPRRGDIFSNVQWIRQLINYEIGGFLSNGGHINDHIAATWMAHVWGADVEYASGVPFGQVPFGDIIMADGKRDPPRDRNGLVIVGCRESPKFSLYRDSYRKKNPDKVMK